ncbi:universal stress protein [Nocardioides sp. BP30]|uniref:universal stress protein n=1 Tax=Nocardioides sp. BP30 TaxID=3036374 RepID=UPI0024684527|nr:universal stress protein [Nocardioides sp. BP30]WGL53931.1 universal stress protein [Nocardioides sp. BP30]
MATVVVGFVPKPEGEAALLAAMEEVQRRGGRLVVASTHRESESDPEWLARTQAELASARERLEAAGIDYAVHESLTDEDVDAADDLVQVARDEQAALLVIGIRRRTPTGKLILGSQAQRILLDAPCPVLAVKPE